MIAKLLLPCAAVLLLLLPFLSANDQHHHQQQSPRLVPRNIARTPDHRPAFGLKNTISLPFGPVGQYISAGVVDSKAGVGYFALQYARAPGPDSPPSPSPPPPSSLFSRRMRAQQQHQQPHDQDQDEDFVKFMKTLDNNSTWLVRFSLSPLSFQGAAFLQTDLSFANGLALDTEEQLLYAYGWNPLFNTPLLKNITTSVMSSFSVGNGTKLAALSSFTAVKGWRGFQCGIVDSGGRLYGNLISRQTPHVNTLYKLNLTSQGDATVANQNQLSSPPSSGSLPPQPYMKGILLDTTSDDEDQEIFPDATNVEIFNTFLMFASIGHLEGTIHPDTDDSELFHKTNTKNKNTNNAAKKSRAENSSSPYIGKFLRSYPWPALSSVELYPDNNATLYEFTACKNTAIALVAVCTDPRQEICDEFTVVQIAGNMKPSPGIFLVALAAPSRHQREQDKLGRWPKRAVWPPATTLSCEDDDVALASVQNYVFRVDLRNSTATPLRLTDYEEVTWSGIAADGTTAYIGATNYNIRSPPNSILQLDLST